MKVKRVPRDVVKAIEELEKTRIGINSVRYYAYYNCPKGNLIRHGKRDERTGETTHKGI